MYIVTIYQCSSMQTVDTTIPASTGVFDAVNTANLIKAGFNLDIVSIDNERHADVCGGKFVTCEDDDSATFPEIQKLLNVCPDCGYSQIDPAGCSNPSCPNFAF